MILVKLFLPSSRCCVERCLLSRVKKTLVEVLKSGVDFVAILSTFRFQGRDCLLSGRMVQYETCFSLIQLRFQVATVAGKCFSQQKIPLSVKTLSLASMFPRFLSHLASSGHNVQVTLE